MVLVIGLVLTIAAARLPSIGATDLEASADRLASTMTWLADESSLRGRLYRLTLDLDAERWEIAALAPWAFSAPGGDGDPGFVADAEDAMARTIALPDGIFLESVVGTEGEDSVGRRVVYFLPEGSDESVRIFLGESGGAGVSVFFNAARGVARVEELEVGVP